MLLIYHRLRAEDPVHQNPAGMWVLSRYDDVSGLLRESNRDTIRWRSGDRVAHEPERGRARLAPVLNLDHPADGGDVAHGRDPLARAGGTSALAGLRQVGLGRAHARGILAPWRGEQADDVLKAAPGRPAASDDTRLERDGYRCQINHASPTVGRRIATRVATASA